MNKFFLIMLFACGTTNVNAQAPAERVAMKIAQKMKDSLALTTSQMQSIYGVNLSLHNQKMAVRQQYNHVDSVTVLIQAIENKRDTLYYPYLNSQQYQFYKQKKRTLIANN